MKTNIFWICAILASSLVRADFTPLDRPIDVAHYKIQMTIDPASDPKEFGATAEIQLRPKKKIAKLDLDIRNLRISNVKLESSGKKKLAFKISDDKNRLEITLPRIFSPSEKMSIVIEYRGNIGESHEGFFKVRDPDESSRGPLLFTHFEADHARLFLPCNDEPADKATSEIIVKLPTKYKAISNGKLVRDTTIKSDGGPWHEMQWSQNKPHSTYLISLAIAPFSELRDKEIPPLSLFVGESKLERAQYCLTTTRQALSFFEKYLELKYPWDKYAVIGLPTYLWGGMENTSATHINQERMLLNDPSSEFEKKRITELSAHELAHQWFGDYVTMKWWDNLWLNESFANYFATLATQHIFDSVEAELETVTQTWDRYFRQEDGPRSHPIVNRNLATADDAADGISYLKGENVLRTLSLYVGETNFKKGITVYLKEHALKNTDYLDFFKAMEKVSQMPLAAFRDSWLLQRGYPILTYGGEWDKTNSKYMLKMGQRPNHKEDTHNFVFKVPVVFHRKATPAYSKQILVTMDKPVYEQAIALVAEPEWVSVNSWGKALVKLEMAKPEEEILAAQALGDPEPIARTWAVNELLKPIIDDKSLSNFAEKTIATMVKNDTSPYVRIAILNALQKSKKRWMPAVLGETLHELGTQALSQLPRRNLLALSDTHGWTEFRSELLGTLGKVDRPNILPLLTSAIQNPVLPLDDLSKTALSVAMLGDARSGELLKEALKIHQDRGYRYKYVVQYAFGAYESPKAAAEIRDLSESCGSDLLGRLGGVISDNQTLKQSKEWAEFLKDFIVGNQRFGEEVKSRLLNTIEEVKTGTVKNILESIAKDSSSIRLREASRKILEANFKS